jgi:calcineurin-like phosphoesterase family protein
MSTAWFTSDLHFMHKMLAEDIRGFSGIEEHDEALIENINSCVKKDDALWILGDLSLKKPAVFGHLFSRLNGNKYVIWGNHDYGWGFNRDAYKYGDEYYYMGVMAANDFARRKMNHKTVMLSHFPYTGDHSADDRYDECRLKNFGNTLLHGHTHSDEIISFAGVNTLQVHVGLDAWNLMPVEINTILELIDENTS